MDRYSGCNCCCVDLDVDNDETSEWDESVDAEAGTHSVTILQSVNLCQFRLALWFDYPETNGSGYFDDFEGNLTILFLADPEDDDADAIGSITFSNKNAWNGTSRTEPLPFYKSSNNASLTANPSQLSTGSGTVDCSAMGISNVTFSHDGFGVDRTDFSDIPSLVIESTDDAVKIAPRGFIAGLTTRPVTICHRGGPSLGSIADLGSVAVIKRTSCTATDVFIRYITSDDFDLNTIGVKFQLQTLNTVGDQSCRTATDYYDAGSEVGNCTTPTDFCGLFESTKKPFIKINHNIDGISGVSGGTATMNEDMWCCESDPSSCDDIFTEIFVFDPPGDTYDFRVQTSLSVTCVSGVINLEINAYANQLAQPGTLRATWNVQIPISAKHPRSIPTTVLNQGNASFWDFPAELTVNYTVN